MSNVQTTKQFAVSGELFTRTKELQKENQSEQEIMEQIYRLGLYQLEYRQGAGAQAARKAYRDKLNAENKAGRELLKRASTDPELAVKLGLGTRVAL